MRLTPVLLVLLTALVAGQSATLPPDINPDSRARLPYLQRKDMDEKTLPIVEHAAPGKPSF